MKEFFKELFKRLSRPTVYSPIIAFLITVAVSSGAISFGNTPIEEIIELAIKVVTAILVAFGILNNPADKDNF